MDAQPAEPLETAPGLLGVGLADEILDGQPDAHPEGRLGLRQAALLVGQVGLALVRRQAEQDGRIAGGDQRPTGVQPFVAALAKRRHRGRHGSIWTGPTSVMA
jgi:hypothetical protein